MTISTIIFLPLIGAILIGIAKAFNISDKFLKVAALATSLATFIISIPFYTKFQIDNPKFQFEENLPWIEMLGINYHVGIDGISLWLVFLTTLITPICILSAWRSIRKSVSGFLVSMLLLETATIGVFCAVDLFLFFLFWEAVLIPMYFLIGIWGGRRRIYATIKFVLYTMAGSAFLLVGILYLNTKGISDTIDLTQSTFDGKIGELLFIGFFIAFAFKVPIFPFHTWLPDAHVEAPTAGSVFLAGVLLKMGTYGILRFCIPSFPAGVEAFTPLMATLSVVGIIYGALVAMVQPDLKKLIAYSSVSHLGFVVLGLFAQNTQSVQGSIIQMVNHGLSTGALFLMVGMVYERRHSRQIADFGGLAKRMPIFSLFFMIATLSSIGLPGLNGFVGEFMILSGSFTSSKIPKIYAIVATSGVILSAIYMLWMFQRVIFGKIENPENAKLKDLNLREISVLMPIMVLIVVIGIYPKIFLDRTENSVADILSLRKVETTQTNSATTTQTIGCCAKIADHKN